MLGKKFQQMAFSNIFLILSQKLGFDISCKLFPFCLHEVSDPTFEFSRKNIISLSSAEFTHSTVSVKLDCFLCHAFHIYRNLGLSAFMP